MGGVGAGCIEMGLDGRFRNITINNNRTADTRIPVSPGAFIAVRATRRGKVFTRLLQSSSDVPFEAAGVAAPYTPEEQLGWRGLYPCARYQLNDERFPVTVRWRAFSPIVPYDLDASTMPVLFLTVEMENPGEDVFDVASVVNWENLRGCTRGHSPEDRGEIRRVPIAITIPPEKFLVGDDEERLRLEKQAQETFIGLEFGSAQDIATNADGHYCLVAQPQRAVEVSLRTWNERDPAEVADFWHAFHYEGFAGNQFARSAAAHSGAVCCSAPLGPKSRVQFIYALTWYCPRFEVSGINYGNGYANAFKNAREVVQRALKHYAYYGSAVEAWQKRFVGSSLPQWFSKMLVNSNSVLSTNSFLAQDGRFAMMETPEDPLMGSIDRRLHSSLGTLLFFPELEHRELSLFAKAKDESQPGRIYRRLGRLSLDEPSFGDQPDELMDINPKFVLMACRNFQMTGRRAAIERMFPRLQQAMEHVLSRDKDRDALPEQRGVSTTFDNWPIYGVNSYTSSLWIAALRAYIRLARHVRREDEARRYEEVLARALKRFEECLWLEEKGYYRVYCDVHGEGKDDKERQDGCHSGQLAGQWYADFLTLGHLFPPERIESALDAMWRMNEMPYQERRRSRTRGKDAPDPARHELTWPSFYLTQCACLHMYHNHPNRGLWCVQRIYQDLQAQGGRTFNMPLSWDVAANEPAGWGADRHMSATAVWHVLYALQGFFLDIPAQTLWLRPNLPQGVHSFSSPILTPFCLGSMEFHDERTDKYRQKVRVAFDSPIRLKSVVLRIPGDVPDVRVSFNSPTGIEETQHVIGYDGTERLVEILPRDSVMVNGPMTIVLEETAAVPTPMGRA